MFINPIINTKSNRLLKNFTLTFLLLLGVFVGSCSPSHRVARARHSSHSKAAKQAVAGNYRHSHKRHHGSARQNIGQKTEAQNIASNNAPQQQQCGQLSTDNSILGKYCSVLGVMPAAMGNFALYNFIDQWMGVHYHYGGRDQKGVDCSAFVQQLYAAVFNVNMVRTAFEQFNFCKLVFESEKLKEGDLVFFRIRHRKISHVGIYLANNFFVHASVSGGVMISSLNDPYWKKYFDLIFLATSKCELSKVSVFLGVHLLLIFLAGPQGPHRYIRHFFAMHVELPLTDKIPRLGIILRHICLVCPQEIPSCVSVTQSLSQDHKSLTFDP